jgi:hypothetical protein
MSKGVNHYIFLIQWAHRGEMNIMETVTFRVENTKRCKLNNT